MPATGVYPVFENKFKIGTAGRASEPTDMKPVSSLETFSVEVTGKSLTITLSGKREIGDEGNDYVAENAWGTGADCDTRFEWEFPDGATLAFDCVLSVTNPGSGDSTDVAALEFEVHSDGKPTYTPAGA